MTKVSIVYFSGTGHTHLMAEAIAAGVQRVEGATAELIRIVGSDIVEGRYQNQEVLDKLSASDAIVFGSPTYMGGIAAQFKAFIDAASSVWFVQGWKDKIAGGFTHSGSPSGDKQGTLLYLAINASQHSMIWVGNSEANNGTVNRLGAYMGVMGQSTPDMSGAPAENDPSDQKTSELYGERIAIAAQRWKKA
ncbi:flavodoxin family protein [Leptolyngbya sp. AN03gr2]|uniref:flavodoxin family protein n=1 Tax=unclassified Leptolyngbya TaxID=2650499 RepID=UPI003D3230BA